MIYKIDFKLNDIQTDSDPWELHFWITNEDEKIANILIKDFIVRLNNDWVVSANKTTFYGKPYWYIKGSIGHVNGNKKYYRKDIKTSFNKEDFNKELRSLFPDIEKKLHKGIFDEETSVMKINQ